MSYELTGKLVAKYDVVQRTATFKTREFAVEKTDDIGGRTVTNYVKFQSVQDKTSIIDKANIGDEIKVGQVLCIVEAMKLFNEIESEVKEPGLKEC